MRDLTAEEAKRHHIAKMGKGLGEQFHELWQEIAYLHMKWQEYLDLGTKESRVELLNKAAPAFFRIVQDVFWEDTLLHIARLMDQQRNGPNKQRLTLRNLAKLVDPAIRVTIEDLLREADKKTAFCRDMRDRHIAHRNLALAINPAAEPIPGATLQDVREALASIVKVLDAVSSHYDDSKSYFATGSHAGGALSLIYVLDSGVRAEEDRRERLLSGKPSEADYKARDL